MKFAICIFLFVANQVIAAQPCQRLQEYDAITSKVSEKFYDRTFKGLDWNARVAHYRERIDCRGDERTLSALVNELLAELIASHTALYTADDLEYWALQSIFSQDMTDFEVAFSGIWPEQRRGSWYAKYVLPNSSAQKAGVQAGDKLFSIDGKPFHPLGFKEQSTSTLMISSDGGATRNIRIAPTKASLQKFFLDASQNSNTIMSVGTKAVGYFRLWAGTHKLFLQSLNSALSNFEEKKIDALVLDLRGGFGGTNLDYLTKWKDSPYLRQIPKFVLIDDGVRSGKELVAATIKHERLGTLVGSRTAGAFLGGSPFRFFDNKYLLYLAVSEWIPPEIGPLEGIGVEPDVAVLPCRSFCSGQDPQLDKAIELIQELPISADK